MTTAYDFFDNVNKSSDHALSSRTLNSLKDFYFGYQRGLEDGGAEMQDGEPPFSQFASWLARRFSKSKPSLFGRWTRYDGGWWRILEEQHGGGEAGFEACFVLLSEFRRGVKVVVCRSNHPINNVTFDSAFDITGLEVLSFPPEKGYYLNTIRSNGRSKIEGFYSTLDEAKVSADKQFNATLE